MNHNQPIRLSTGIQGFDEILHGGLVPGQAYLLRGGPGTGKTTFGLHFLCEGVLQGEPGLLISFAESEASLRRNAQMTGFNFDGIAILDLSPTSDYFSQNQSYDIFSPADVERGPITEKIIEKTLKIKPKRVFIDSMAQFRYLATENQQFHKQVLSFIRFLIEQGGTILFTSESSELNPDDDLQFLSDGVINLSYDSNANIRLMRISKLRGASFEGGNHVIRLTDSGMLAFPRLRPDVFSRKFVQEKISSGIPGLDEMLHGGIERGTVTIVSGPSGVGKTTFGIQFMKEAAGRGERSVVFTFEEHRDTIIHRCTGINIPVQAMLNQGTLSIVEIEALLLSADEFAQMVRQEVEEQNARIVMIDSISGYKLSIQGDDLVPRIHALCRYLQNMGVTVILVNEIDSVTGEFQATGIGISYLSDNIIFLRHLEVRGRLRKAIGVLKKRLTGFEQTLREFELTQYGVKIGKPLTNLRRILSGIPDWLHEPGQEE